jgi:hypothetical protein
MLATRITSPHTYQGAINDHAPIVIACKFLSACSNVADPAHPPVATAVKQVVTTLLSTRRGDVAAGTKYWVASQCTDHTPVSDPPLIAQRMVSRCLLLFFLLALWWGGSLLMLMLMVFCVLF